MQINHTKVKRWLLMMLLMPALSWACSAPRAGEDYDALINVEKIGTNTFTVRVPQTAFDLHYGADIRVVYYAKGDKHRLEKHWREIKKTKEGSEYVATFELHKIAGHIPLVQVYWYPEFDGLCGAFASSEDLVLE